MKLPSQGRWTLLIPALVVIALVLSFAVETARPERSSSNYALVAHLIAKEDFIAAQRVHQEMLVRLVRDGPDRHMASRLCWSDNSVPWPMMDALNQAIQGALPEFELGGRWGSVATPGGGTGQGDPTTLTYSFVPDSTFVPSGVGEPAANSDMFATFNSLFGSTAAWQNAMHLVFVRWGELTGITYVHEPNDDGATLGSSSGIIGVRGDIRVSGKSIDGQSGGNVLAYNSFPSGGGDMVLDTDNTSFFGNSNSNWLRLRQTMMHEHGHGLGLYHVCPDNGEKLMEPFINLSFDGPQLDDVLGGQRHYGDANEHNDNVATATSLGALGNGTTSYTQLSIDDNTDQDYYSFAVTGNKSVNVTVSPSGTPYQTGPQTSTCNTGGTYDPTNIHDLGIQVLDTDGTTVLATANVNPAGQNEVIFNLTLVSGPGTYYVRVFGSSNNSVQPYSATLTIQDTVLPAFTISYPNGVPATITPSSPATIDLQTTNVTGAPDPSSGLLFVSVDGGLFSSGPLTHLGSGAYQGTLPATPCFAQLRWYVSIVPLGGGAPVVSPQGAPTFVVHTTQSILSPLTQVFADNFQTNMGWSVTNDAGLTDGAWTRGVPVGGGARGDPPTDSDGSGSCYLTDNAAGNSDVDGGSTTLTSPVVNLQGVPDAVVQVDFWYDNDFGSNPSSDVFTVQISSNGGSSWSNLEIYNASVDAWVHREYRLSDFPVSLTNQMRVRFIASDPPPNGSVVEAGVDAFKVLVCQPPIPPVSLDPTCSVGNVGITVGPPEQIFLVNVQNHAPSRVLDLVAGGGSAVYQLHTPSLSSGPVPYAIFGTLGIAGPGDAISLPLGLGGFCFNLGLLDPTNPNLFVLVDTFTNGAALVPNQSLTPLLMILPPPPFPLDVTLQGIVLETPTMFRVTNAIGIRWL